MQNVEVKVVEETSGDGGNVMAKRIFLCPAHACWTCSQLDLKKQETEASKEATKQEGKKNGKKRKKKQGSSFISKNEAKLFVSACVCTQFYYLE
jgi:hypothetical protein